MVVTFYKTVKGGQQVAGKITFDGETLQGDTALAKGLLKTLMQGVDRDDPAQVEKVLRSAPERYTGGYMRAAFEGDKAGVENGLIAAALAGKE